MNLVEQVIEAVDKEIKLAMAEDAVKSPKDRQRSTIINLLDDVTNEEKEEIIWHFVEKKNYVVSTMVDGRIAIFW